MRVTQGRSGDVREMQLIVDERVTSETEAMKQSNVDQKQQWKPKENHIVCMCVKADFLSLYMMITWPTERYRDIYYICIWYYTLHREREVWGERVERERTALWLLDFALCVCCALKFVREKTM